MPKATFFRLPKAKQQRLMDAAYQEFARAPFNEASISNIIKQAGILSISMIRRIFIFICWKMSDSGRWHSYNK